MAHHDLIVVGASAGGIDPLRTIVSGLPADLAASIFVVVHVSPDSPGYLPQILAHSGRLPAIEARHGEEFRRGAIYIAPVDHHLLIDGDRTMQVTWGPRENRMRPAIDPLFRSAANAFGPRVIGVILSGALNDGTAGLNGIKMCGGVSVVQDPSDALASSMPKSALMNATIDHVRPAGQLAELLVSLVNTPAGSSLREAIPASRKRSVIEPDLLPPRWLSL